MTWATSNMRTSESEVLHEFIERVDLGGPHLLSEMGIDRGRFRAAVPEIVLNQTQMNAGFHQVCRVGMTQRVHVSAFRNARLFQCAIEGALQTGSSNRAHTPRNVSGNTGRGGEGKSHSDER